MTTPQAPLTLNRVTTELDETQDRLRLTGDLDSGEPVVFWITRRMLKRLLPHLLAWLQPAAEGTQVTAAADYHTDAIQSFAQQAAVAELAQHQQAPVQAPQQTSQWLIDSIDMTRTPDIIALTFKSGELHAALLLAQQPLRQWLAIVHEQSTKAEWALDLWPQWILDSAPNTTRQVRATVH